MSSRERTGWRDMAISQRHRLYGYDCPMFDIDFMCVEYDKSMPVCLVEYKNIQGQLNVDSANIKALINLGNMANLPAFAALYVNDFSLYLIYGLNDLAKKYFSSPKIITEVEWVEFLYKLRGKNAPMIVLRSLNGFKKN